MSTLSDLKKRLSELEENKPEEYVSQYDGQIKELSDRINNREKFNYDMNADVLYQQYRDQYQNLGKLAAKNAAGAAAALSGGYGNSYGASAAAQANQQYLTKLNDVIPSLYAAAYNRYTGEGNDMFNQLNVIKNAEATDYARYRDKLSDWQSERNYLNNAIAAATPTYTSSGSSSKSSSVSSSDDGYVKGRNFTSSDLKDFDTIFHTRGAAALAAELYKRKGQGYDEKSIENLIDYYSMQVSVKDDQQKKKENSTSQPVTFHQFVNDFSQYPLKLVGNVKKK